MFKRGCVVLLLIVASACAGSNTTLPTAPSATTPSSVTVNCQTTTFTTAGQQTQCSAVVVLSNGTSQDQTLAAQWSSGNAGIASVSASGLVTAVSSGSATITATFQGLQGARAVAIALPTLTLAGTLTDGTSHGILPNITVEIVSGMNVGKTAVTDSSGDYAMSGLSAGTFTVSVSSASYQTTTQQIALSANTRADLVLQRAALTSVTVSCSTYTIGGQGGTVRCAATAHYLGGSSFVLTSGVTWQALTTVCSGSCAGNGVASVDPTGLVMDRAIQGVNGTAIITATYQGTSGTATFSIVGSCLIC